MNTITSFEVSAWQQVGTAAILAGLRDTGLRFNRYSELPLGTRIPSNEYDILMFLYRQWLNHDRLPQI